MRKYNEGYVLAMVMGVIAVLAVVASTMLSVGLRNVITQQNAMGRMQAKYEAEGEIEKIVTELAELKTDKVADAASAFKTKFDALCKKYNDNQNDGIQITNTLTPEQGSKIYTFTIETEKGYTISVPDKKTIKTINESIIVKNGIEMEYQIKDLEEGGVTKHVAQVKNIKYTLYEMSTTRE